MKIILHLLLLLCASATAAAAEPLYQHGRYEPGTVTAVFTEGANLRAFPTTAAPVMTRAALGTMVTILEMDTATYAAERYREAWYRVRCPLKDGTVMLGYMWGGALAKAVADLPQGRQLLVGITRSDTYGRKTCAARVVQSGKMLAQTSFPAIETDPSGDDTSGYTFSYSLDASCLASPGFTPPLTVLRVGFIYEACDYTNGDVLLLWDGRKLGYGLTAHSAGNELGNVNYAFIFPGDSGGQAGRVLVNYTAQEYNDSATALTTRQNTEKWELNRDSLTLRRHQ